MSLFENIQKELIVALKAHDTVKVDTLRFLISAIKKFDMDTYLPGSDKSLTEEDVMKVIQKQVKTHKESVEAFTKGNRPDLAEKEQKELDILLAYVPKELTDGEIEQLVNDAIAHGGTQFGLIMASVMKRVAGRADGQRVSAVVKRLISQ